jgi:hypothetical protein
MFQETDPKLNHLTFFSHDISLANDPMDYILSPKKHSFNMPSQLSIQSRDAFSKEFDDIGTHSFLGLAKNSEVANPAVLANDTVLEVTAQQEGADLFRNEEHVHPAEDMIAFLGLSDPLPEAGEMNADDNLMMDKGYLAHSASNMYI